MTNKTKHLSSILSLDEGLPFDNAILVASLLPTCKWYCRFDPRVYHDHNYRLNDITLQLLHMTGASLLARRWMHFSDVRKLVRWAIPCFKHVDTY